MKLQAISICVGYSDYLECVIDNRKHFDKWFVITSLQDEPTHELCRRERIQCVTSKLLGPNDLDFDPVLNKSRVVNEALGHLDPDGWVLILDSDVLLPYHFRERVEAQKLDSDWIYRVQGRKICRTRDVFDMLRGCEPWVAKTDQHAHALRFCALWNLGSGPNRYPVKSLPGTQEPEDEAHFASSLPDCRVQCLPFTVLHAGRTGAVWKQRITAEIVSSMTDAEHQNGRTGIAFAVRSSGSASGVRAAICGYCREDRWRMMIPSFGHLYIIEQHQVHGSSESPFTEIDRGVLRDL